MLPNSYFWYCSVLYQSLAAVDRLVSQNEVSFIWIETRIMTEGSKLENYLYKSYKSGFFQNSSFARTFSKSLLEDRLLLLLL